MVREGCGWQSEINLGSHKLWSTARYWRYSIPRKMNTHFQIALTEVYSIGATAAAILSAGERGNVIANLTGAAYLQNQHGEICWLIPIDAPMHRRGIKTVGQIPHLRTGSSYYVADHALVIDSAAQLDFQHSDIWEEPGISINGLIPLSDLPVLLDSFAEQLFKQYNPSGFGCLIIPILELTTQKEDAFTPRFENRIAEKAWPDIKGLIRAYRERDKDQLFFHAQSLIGMGQGLTPSGDDFLGGFFLSIRLLIDNYPKIGSLRIRYYSDFILDCSTLTTRLSYSILLDAIEGHSVEPVHHLANGILTGLPVDRLLPHAQALVSLGHSTGWDLLAGFIAGISAVIG